MPPPIFTFYLHDRADCCQLQLLGALTAKEIPELQGCCKTVESSLLGRKLVIDLRAVTGVDADGEKWLAAKRAEGADVVDLKTPPAQASDKPLKRFFAASSSTR